MVVFRNNRSSEPRVVMTGDAQRREDEAFLDDVAATIRRGFRLASAVQTLAAVVFAIVVIGAIAGVIALLSEDDDLAVYAIPTLGVGIAIALLLPLCCWGFGVLL